MLFDLKNIQPILTKTNVPVMDSILIIRLFSFSSMVTPLFFFICFGSPLKIISIPWNKPQITNVQFAPCQRPETSQTIRVLITHLQTGTLFPPSGI